MTLLVRDEADIVDAQIAYHLDAGVDAVVATDNRSEDATTEILERYAREGVLHLIREPGDDLRQSEWVTRMARLAATELGADWVLNADADEFWRARGTTLKELLAVVPGRFGAVRGAWRNFVPRPDDDRFFAERMTARLCTPSFHPHPLSTHFKSAHRARADIRIGRGNHEALADDLVALRGWYPIEILHFPVRSLEHCRRKYVTQFVALERNAEKGIPGHMAEAYTRLPRGPARRLLRAARRGRRRARGGARGRHATRSTRGSATRSAGSASAPPGARSRRSPHRRAPPSRRRRSSRPSTPRSGRRTSGPSTARGSTTWRRASAASNGAPPPASAASSEARVREELARPAAGLRADAQGRARPLRAGARGLLVPGPRLADGQGQGHLGLPRLLPPALRLRPAALAGPALPRAPHAPRRGAADGPRRDRPPRDRLRRCSSRARSSRGARRRSPSAGSPRSRRPCSSSSIPPGRPSTTRRRATRSSRPVSRSGP